MSLFDEIQSDILNPVPLSTILRKAKVLAYRLGNREFKDWVEYELNGYSGHFEAPPEYRNISTQSFGQFINSGWHINDAPIPTSNLPSELQEIVNQIEVHQGVRELESMIESLDNSQGNRTIKSMWPSELLPYLNNRVYQNMNCIGAWRVISRSQISKLLDNTRNRLLSFVLELADRYPDEASKGFNETKAIPDEQIRQVFNYYIMGGSHNIVSSNEMTSRGSNMTIFDQRNQNVSYQYNAAGNINFDAVQSRSDLLAELEKLKAELSIASTAKAIDAEVVTDAEYQITKAIQQSQRVEPNKNVILDHIKQAKTIVEGITLATGLVNALVKAAELVQKLF